jgi:hypothetical protein
MEMTIEYEHDEFYVYEHGVYEDSSVLAGRSRRILIEVFPTRQDAELAYPNAVFCEHSTRIPFQKMSDTPPDWFDPTYAGEEW